MSFAPEYASFASLQGEWFLKPSVFNVNLNSLHNEISNTLGGNGYF